MPLHGEIVVIKRNGTDGTHFPLTAKSCLFGRKSECDIRIQLPHVSKEHCKVDVKDNGEVFVTNLSTVNPTQINGTTVKQPVLLKHGDVLTIIDRSFRFEKPSAQQGKRRSTGLDSETFKVFASNQSSDTNETVRVESLLTSKTQRKSDGRFTRTTYSRRSLQISSSSEPRRDMSPFGELYEMLKSEVKQNGKTPVKDKSSSPKNVALKRSLQIQDNAQTPVAPKRTPRRSHSSDGPTTGPKEVVVERRSASAGRVREASKSPSRSPKSSTKAANQSFQGESEQTKRRSPGKQDSPSVPQEQVSPVNGNIEKRSPRRSASAEQSQVLTPVQSTPKNAKTPDSSTSRRRSNQAVPEQPVLKETSPRGKSPTQGRRNASLDNVQKGTPNKPAVTEDKTSEGPRRSPRKRRSDELSLPVPPPKRKRVSFGGHLSPELFDKRLPPNSPLKKGATPARRSLSLNSPRTPIRKSFGLKQSVIREVFERSGRSSVTPTPASASQSSPSKYSVKSSPAVTESGKSQVSRSPTKPSALVKTPAKSPSARRSGSARSPDVNQTAAPITPVKNSPAKSAVKTPSTSSKMTSGQKSLSANSPVKSPSRSPKTPSKSPKGLTIKPLSTTPVETPSPVAKTPTPSRRAKTPSPAKKTPVAKTPTPAKRSKTSSPVKKTPVAKTPTQSTHVTPYMKGRFSVSRIDTPPQETAQSELPPSRTPNKSRKSLSMKKTPRRSRKLEALELIRSRRRSGATEANLLVSRTWADVVKIGVAKSQKKFEEKPVQKTVATKKKLKHKTPMKKIKDLASTGHADSPATILVGRAHTRTVNLTGYVPKVVRNQAVKRDFALNDSFTGVAELFTTPVIKQRKSNRLESSNTDSPSSTAVEVSAMQTPEGSGEMVVSPLNGINTTRRKQYGQDAVSRLLHSPVSPELHQEGKAALELAKEASKSQRNERKSVGLSGVKQMRTPKQKGGQVTDPHALKKLLRTPKVTESPQASSRRSINLEVLGIDRLVRTPKQKGVPVENFSGLQRIMKTPKQKAEHVEVLTAVKRIMRTPKERVQPIEDMIGIKRVMRTPKEKSQPVEDMVGIKRIMRSPKERGQPVEDMVGIKRIMSTPKDRGQLVEDYELNHLMNTPVETIHSAESTRPIEEIFGMRNLIKTPTKSPVGKEVVSTDPSKYSANSSANTVRGRPSKRLNLQVDSSSGNYTHETVQSQIEQEVVTQSSQEVNSVQKRGRPSKSQRISSSELPKKHIVSAEVTSPRGRGRPSSASKGSLSASDAEVTSPTQRERPKSVTESPKKSVPFTDGKVTSPTRRGRPSTPAAAPKESASAIIEVTPRRRGRPSSVAKESVSSSDAEATSLAEPEIPKVMAEAPNESVSYAVSEVTSPRRRGRPSSRSKAPEESLSTSHVDITSPNRRGRPSSTAKESDSEVTSSTQPGTPKALTEAPKESTSNAVSKVTSPRRRGRSSSTAKAPEPLSDAVMTSPRHKGRQSSTAKESLSVSDTEVTSSTQPETPKTMAETPNESTSDAAIEVTSPRLRGRPSSTSKAPKESLAASDAELTSPRRRGRPRSNGEAPKSPVVSDGQKTPTSHKKRFESKVASPEESVTVADSSSSGEVVSPRHRGRPSSTGKAENPKESVPIVDKVTSPTRRGRPSTSAVINDSVPVTSPTTTEVLMESLPVSQIASPARRGRPKKDRALIPEESVPIAKHKLTSPTHKKPSSPSEIPTEPVSDSGSITKDPIPVAEGKASSQTRRGRQAKVDLPKEPSAPEVQITRGSRSKGTVVKAELSVSVVDELQTTQTRRRPKASSQVAKVSPAVPEVDVSSPTRGSRSKGISEAPKDTVQVLNDVAISEKRRGRPKVADVTVESIIVSEVTVPTRGSRSKYTANASDVSVLAVEEVTAQKRRGRLRKADVSKESGAVSEVTSSVEERNPKSTEDGVSEVVSPTRKGRSRNTEAPVSDSVTSPKRKPETTEGELDLLQAQSEDTNEKTAKSSKKTIRQNAKKPSKQAPEPEETIPVAEKKTQLPPRGRRKAAKNEPIVPEGDPNSSLEDKQPEGLTVNTSPVARRGGRRRNAELSSIESNVTKPKTSKQETRSRGRSKSKGLTEENVRENSDSSTPEEPVKSPEPKSPYRSPARQTNNLASELPVESQPKSLRGRPSKKVHFTEASNVASSETEAPQKPVPARGRARTARDGSASDAGEQTRGSSRRNQTLPEDSSASLEEPIKSVSRDKKPSSRGTLGKKTSDSEPHSSPEVKARRIAKGRILKNVEEQTIPKSNTKSVQWHPLLDTDIQSTTNAVSAENSNEAFPRAGRLKGKTKPDASELKVTTKRSRRGNQAEAEELPASTNPESLAVSEDVPHKRGRKANVQKRGEAIDTKAESAVSTEVVQAIPQRGRRGAPSKVVDIESNDVHNVEPSTSRRQRGVAARRTPTEEIKSTQSPVKSQKAGMGKGKSEEVSSKSTRGVKRKLPNAEVKIAPVGEPETPSQTSESVLVETENIPAGRGRKNQRNAKTQKGDVQEALPEKQTVTADSPAKRRKTEAATTAVQKKSSRQTSKLETEKPSVPTKTRASTRSRK